LITTAIAAASVMQLHVSIVAELRRLQRMLEIQYLTPQLLPYVPPTNLDEAKQHADLMKTNLSIRMSIGKMFAKAKDWPLPVGWIPAFGLSLAGQLVNMIAPLLPGFKP
jgi:hypothetical protein